MTTKRKKRNSFSLLEILVTVAILSAVMAGIGINIPVLLRHERFESGVERILNEIKCANELMILYQTDVTLNFKKKEGGVLCSYDIATPEIRNVFKNKTLFIKGIDSLHFEGHEKEEIALKFCADEYGSPRGRITFGCKGKEKNINLYPNEFKNRNFWFDGALDLKQRSTPEEASYLMILATVAVSKTWMPAKTKTDN